MKSGLWSLTAKNLLSWLRGGHFRLPSRRVANRRLRRSPYSIAAPLAAEVLCERVLLSAVTWTGGAGTQNWGDAANWSGNATPGASDDATIDVPGNITINAAGNFAVHSLATSDALTISSGSFAIYGDSQINATLTNAGNLSVNGAVITGTGHIVNASGAMLSTFDVTFNALDNAGTWEVENGAQVDGTLTTGAGSTIRLLGGIIPGSPLGDAVLTVANGFTNHGELDLSAGGAFSNDGVNSTLNVSQGTLVNAAGGTIRALLATYGTGFSGDGDGRNRILNATIDNQGLLETDYGLTWNNGSGPSSNEGTIQVSGPHVDQFNLNQSKFTNSGTIEVPSGRLDISNGPLESSGSWLVTGVLTMSNVALTLDSDTTVSQTGTGLNTVTVDGPGTLVNPSAGTLSTFDVTFNALDNAGTWEVEGDAQVNGQSSNEGTIEIATGNLTITGPGLTNATSGVVDDRVDGVIGNAASCPTLTNEGLFVKSGGNDVTDLEMDLVSSGTIKVESGTLNVSCGFVQTAGSTIASGGTLTGQVSIQGGAVQGSVSADISVSGQVSVVPSSAPIIPATSYTQTSTGVLNELIGGPVAGTQYGQIAVTGTVTLSGKLHVSLTNGFSPATGEVFTITRNDGSAKVNGTFTGLAEGAKFIAGGWQFQISYQGGDGNDVTLTAITQPTSTVLTSSTAASTYGDQVTFTATVVPQSGGIPSGTATFYEVTSTGSVISQLGTTSLNGSGVAAFANAGFSAGTHYVAAMFTSNNAGFLDSASASPVSLLVNRKSVSGVIVAYNKVYDGTTMATLSSQSLTGVLAADAGNVVLNVASAAFSDPNAGTGKTVTATSLSLTGSAAANYVLSATTATTTANITAKVLLASGSTQNTINIAKNGTLTFTITNVSGKVDGDTRSNYQLFNGAKFTLQIGSHIYSLVSTASVDQKTGTIYVSWNLSDELYNDLVAVLGPNTSPSAKQLTDLIVSGYSNDGNYEITADCMANIFSTGKVTWS